MKNFPFLANGSLPRSATGESAEQDVPSTEEVPLDSSCQQNAEITHSPNRLTRPVRPKDGTVGSNGYEMLRVKRSDESRVALTVYKSAGLGRSNGRGSRRDQKIKRS